MKVNMKVLVVMSVFVSLILGTQVVGASVGPQKNKEQTQTDQDCNCGRIIYEDGQFFLHMEGDELPAELDPPPKWFSKENIQLLDGADVTFELKFCEHPNGEVVECIELHSKNPGVERLVHPKAEKLKKRSKR